MVEIERKFLVNDPRVTPSEGILKRAGDTESQQLDISDLKTGVYFARSNQLEAIKIIKR